MRISVATLATFALIAIGCSSPAEPEAPAASDSPPPAETTETDSGTPETASGSASELTFDDLIDRFGSGPMGAGQVTYQWEATGMPSGATMTIAQDPPNMATLWESPEGNFLTISGDNNAVCFGTGGEWQCMPTDMGLDSMFGDDPFDDIVEFDDVEDLGFDPAAATITSETIVGRAATCMSVDEATDVDDLTVCLDEETGIMLRASGSTTEGSYRVEATSFSAPDPTLFVPPAEPMDMPTDLPFNMPTS